MDGCIYNNTNKTLTKRKVANEENKRKEKDRIIIINAHDTWTKFEGLL